MVVVVVAVVVVFVFVFPAAVYITLRLSASKPVSMCTKKIGYLLQCIRACACVCARTSYLLPARTSDPLKISVASLSL